MKLIIVTELSRYNRAVNTIYNYAEAGRGLGHQVAVFAEQQSEKPPIPCSREVDKFDFVIFVVYNTTDFPDLPYLAQILDGIPKERRILIDCNGRYNETIRVEHDFNHLERLEGHQGWEWVEGFRAVASKILQPTLEPLRDDVIPFLFHGYDPTAVSRSYHSAQEAARSWAEAGRSKPYGVVYVGNNWHRWHQLRSFLEEVQPLHDELGPTCLVGWNWDKQPDWAAEMDFHGMDVDTALLQQLGVEVKTGIPFNEVIDFVGKGQFSPILHRPLYNELGLVTNRTFETFCADTVPVALIPKRVIEAIYGPAAAPLAPNGDVAGHLRHAMADPESQWDAVLRVRQHLAEYHSYERRMRELMDILES
jgi:hypothetical protein